MGRQRPVHFNPIFITRQLVKDYDVLGAYRFFRSGTQAHQRGGKSCPRTWFLSCLLLFLELLVENFNKVAETFLAKTDLSLFFCFFIHLNLDGLSKLILVLLNHLQRLDQWFLMCHTFLGLVVEISQMCGLGCQILYARGLLKKYIFMGVNLFLHHGHFFFHQLDLFVQLANLSDVLLHNSVFSIKSLL